MRKDKVYWLYLTQALLESFQYLDEAGRKFMSYNLHYQVANNMAHSGENANSIHSHLSNMIDPSYHVTAYSQWYEYGGEAPVISYLRNIAKHHYDMSDSVKHPEIDEVPMHKAMVHPEATDVMDRIHTIAKAVHRQKLPETITIYRGVGLPENVTMHNPYVPHALESWTTDLNTAQNFSRMSHIKDSIPHVLKATIHRDDILLSHHMKDKLPFIPADHELEGKEEIVPLGHKIKNIERIE